MLCAIRCGLYSVDKLLLLIDSVMSTRRAHTIAHSEHALSTHNVHLMHSRREGGLVSHVAH